MKKVIIASRSKNKLEEIKTILKDLTLDIKNMDDIGLVDLKIMEDGVTFEENAMKKACEVMKAVSGNIVIADDSGLEVKAIGNKPGVYTSRFAGKNATDRENNQKLLRLMKNIPMEQRDARFISVIAAIFPDGKKFSVRGDISGKIGYQERGKNGFGYDPLFIVEKYAKTFAEMPHSLKNEISHRARALKKLKEKLREIDY